MWTTKFVGLNKSTTPPSISTKVSGNSASVKDGFLIPLQLDEVGTVMRLKQEGKRRIGWKERYALFILTWGGGSCTSIGTGFMLRNEQNQTNKNEKPKRNKNKERGRRKKHTSAFFSPLRLLPERAKEQQQSSASQGGFRLWEDCLYGGASGHHNLNHLGVGYLVCMGHIA